MNGMRAAVSRLSSAFLLLKVGELGPFRHDRARVGHREDVRKEQQ